MTHLISPTIRLIAAFVWLAAGSARGELLINEILFNPPGPDAPNEYIELRGTPNLIIPNGTYFVSIAGDTNANPGTVKNVFDLSGKAVGGNGFLVLLQKTNSYTAFSNATVLVNTDSGPGWGSGSTSSIKHRGDNGLTDLQNASVTFFLIQTTNQPTVGTDMDADDDGMLDAPLFASWTVLDSVGVLGNNGLGDIAYGAINFRKNPGAIASGTIVPVSVAPGYVGRSANTTGAAAADWVASANLGGSAPNFTLGTTTNTVPSNFAGAALNHIGIPNFGAPAIPGVGVWQSGGSTDVSEDGATDSYTISLATTPAGSVTIQVSAEPQLQISTNAGLTFGSNATINLSGSAGKIITVRSLDDNVVDTSPHPALIHHVISATSDPAHYPLSSIIPAVSVNITDNDVVLLNELKVNPPGITDGPFEYVEIRGAPGALLTNVYLLAIDGNIENDPGTIGLAINLTSARLGSNGLLVVMATNAPYAVPSNTAVFADSRFNAPGGALDNGTTSFLLISTPGTLKEGKDLDAGNNGILEGLPPGTTILDSIGWSDGNTNDVVYGGAVLTFGQPTPDAATRFPGNNARQSVAAWFFGELAGTDSGTLIYDTAAVSTNFPFGTILSPGGINNTSVGISPLGAFSGVISDPTNPGLVFTVSDSGGSADALVVTASSSNPTVVPDTNLLVTPGSGGLRFLTITPVGVGYASIVISASGSHGLGQITFPYAASAMGRPGGRFHTGASDGSTAIAIDADLMFVGDDQNQVIRLFRRHFSGPAVTQFDFQSYLGLTEQEKGEVDIEASTRVGNRLFWLGSQSNNNLAQSRTNRTRVFATDLSGSGAASTLTYVGRYDHLKEDLLNWDMNNVHGKGSNYYGFLASTGEGVDPKSPAGFNIEGLSMAPSSTNVAWLGFRAPLVPPGQRAAALLVPVTNFDTLVVSGGPPGSAHFGPPIELNLRCRGVRSMEAGPNGVLISAGPPGKLTGTSPGDYRLFTWSGNAADTPQERAADLTGMNPEGIVEVPTPPWNTNTQVQLISDDGNSVFYNDGIEAKHLAIPGFKKFRSDWVALGEVVVSRPACYTFSVTNITTGLLSWCSVAGLTYRVQWKNHLQDNGWSDVSGDVTATGPLTSKEVPAGQPGQRFFRVLVVQ